MSNTDWIGFLGVFLILLAYFLNVLQKLPTHSLPFILLNLCGASLACLASVILNYLPFIILEGIWAFIYFVSLLKYKKQV